MVPFEMLQQEFASPPRPCLLQVDVDEASLSHKVAQQQTLSGEGRDAGLGLHEALQLRWAGCGRSTSVASMLVSVGPSEGRAFYVDPRARAVATRSWRGTLKPSVSNGTEVHLRMFEAQMKDALGSEVLRAQNGHKYGSYIQLRSQNIPATYF